MEWSFPGWSFVPVLGSQSRTFNARDDVMTFASLADFRAQLADLPRADDMATGAAQARNGQLTKPPGALGRLEDLAIWMAGWQGTDRPHCDRPQVIVFAGNHGVTAQGVSAFPAEVTVQMVANFRAGGAAINQLARTFGASMTVHALNLDQPTADFTTAPAMTEGDLLAALATGWNAVDPDADTLVTGEMGIGNTTPAAALACALFGGAASTWVGRGTGVDDAGLARKATVVTAGIARHADILNDPLQVLRCLGGRELAAMAGAIARAHKERIPVILDGFICTAAAAVLERAAPGALDHCVAGHLSAEGAHGRLLEALGKSPLLSLNLRLGEGSGAALALGIVKGAVACHSGMATFAEAGVSGA
jgi:nicotinate-nucleotide--dimethylbenzimidazole phosphoribosyltransferase